jgi:hypothetical protein
MIHVTCVGSRVRNHDFDKSKLLFQLSGIFRMKKTYATRLFRINSHIDLTHFSAGNEMTVYRHCYWNCGCACYLQTVTVLVIYKLWLCLWFTNCGCACDLQIVAVLVIYKLWPCLWFTNCGRACDLQTVAVLVIYKLWLCLWFTKCGCACDLQTVAVLVIYKFSVWPLSRYLLLNLGFVWWKSNFILLSVCA